MNARKPSEILREMPRDQWQVGFYCSTDFRHLPAEAARGRWNVTVTEKPCYCAMGWLIRAYAGDEKAGGTLAFWEAAEITGLDYGEVRLVAELNDHEGLDAVIAYFEEQGL